LALFTKRKRELVIIIDDYTIRFLEITSQNDRIKVIHHKSTINNVIMKDGVIDKSSWNAILKQQLKLNKIKARFVTIVIPSSTVILRQQTMPDLPKKNLKEILNFEIGNTIHFPFINSVFDFIKLETNTPIFNENGEPALQLALIAAPSDLIIPIIEVLRRNKLRVTSVEIPALSLYRLGSYSYPDLKDEVLLLSYITKDGVDIHIVDRGIPSFTRHIPMDLRGHLQSYDSEAAVDEELTVSEGIKKEKVYIAFSADLAFELERAINFYHYTLNNREKSVSSCLIATDLDFTEGFYNVLNERIEQEVKPLYFQFGDVKGYEVGIGVFLEKQDKRYEVNLMPKISKFKRYKWLFASAFGALIIAYSLLLGLLYIDKSQLLKERNSELDQLIIEREEKQLIFEQDKEDAQLFTEYLTTYESLQQQHINLVPFLDDLSKLLPVDEGFVKIYWTNEGVFNITGEFSSLDVLGHYIELLNQLNWIVKVDVLNVTELSKSTITENEVVSSTSMRIIAELDIYIDPAIFDKGENSANE